MEIKCLILKSIKLTSINIIQQMKQDQKMAYKFSIQSARRESF